LSVARVLDRDDITRLEAAERAGLIKGDVLTQIGDVVLESVHDLTYALGRFKPGDVVAVKYTRDGQAHETRVTLVAPAGDVR
jgi:S1-C subfamily serine protease